MGSAGTGKFGTYRITESVTNGVGIGMDGSGEVECPDIIENIKLEDVATSDFYINNHMLPRSNSHVQLRNIIYQGRLVVENSSTHEIIGNLPVQYNYLLNYLKSGKQYKGKVVSSGIIPIPFVVVTLNV